MNRTDAIWLQDDVPTDDPVDLLSSLPGVRSGLARRLDGEAGFLELRELCDRPIEVFGGRARPHRGRRRHRPADGPS